MINTKRIYTLATVNGISHKEVKDYIWKEWGLGSTKDLDQQQYKSLITYLDREEIPVATEKIYAKGLYGKQPHEKAPDFVVGQLSFKVTDFYEFLQQHVNEKGYVNIDILKGKEGKLNGVLNEWKPTGEQSPKAEAPKKAVPVVQDAVVVDDSESPF